MPVDWIHTVIGIAYFVMWALIAHISMRRRAARGDGPAVNHML